jgi:predicted PurR-regulated permease PerM
VLIASAVAVSPFLAWQLSHVLLLVFGAVLVAVVLRSLTDLIERLHPCSGVAGRWPASAALVAIVLITFLVLLGTQIRMQFETLVDGVPDLIETVEEVTGVSGMRTGSRSARAA